MANILGSGTIKVIVKDDNGGYVHLLCASLEVYGETLAFSDKDGDLVKYENTNNIIQVSPSRILRCSTKK